VKNDATKVHSDPTEKDGALGFLEKVCDIMNKKYNNKMSRNTGSDI